MDDVPAMPFQPASSALSRFTVLDLSRVRAGPACVRVLADWGANVIKVEEPAAQQAGDMPGGDRHGADFQNLHRNKRSLALNLKRPEGREVLLRLVRKADVLVENYRPDVKHRLGIDYATLAAVRPELVYASISGFGQDGPYADRPGFDQVAQGLGGLMSITGAPGGGPMRVGIPIADLSAGLFCALGILVALLQRDQTGQGQWVTTSLLEAQVAMLDFQAARWLMHGEVPGQAGNDHPTMIPTGAFRAADGFINIAVTGHAIWDRFCRALGAAELIDHPDYRSAALRSKNRGGLNALINARLAGQPRAHWLDLFAQAEVPAGPINTIDQVFADPQVRHLGLAQSVDSPALGAVRLVAQPVTLSAAPRRLAAAAPDVGQHSDEILGEFGYTAAEIDALRRGGVL